jgi:multidrug efflux pump subunit AcrB
VIGGVLVSTFLTLLVVPCFYSLMPGKSSDVEV